MITLARLVAAAQRDLVPYWPVPLPVVELTGVHVSELEDPTVFLDGGELLLTVGLSFVGLDAAARATACRKYVDRLVAGRVAALGLGLGSGHAMVPDELREACVEADLPLLTVPRESPFLAVSRAYWEMVRKGGEAELTALLGLQVALTRAAAQPNAEPAIVHELSRALGTWVAYLPDEGPMTSCPDIADLPPGLADGLVQETSKLKSSRQGATANIQLPSGTASLYPVAQGTSTTGYLALGRSGQMVPAERHLFLTASTLLAAIAAGHARAREETRRAESMLGELVLEGHDDAARLLAKQMSLTPLPESAYLIALPDALPARWATEGIVVPRPGATLILQDGTATRPTLPGGTRGAWSGPIPLRRVQEITAQVIDASRSAPIATLVRVGHGLDLPADEWVEKLKAHPGHLLETVRAYLATRGQWEAAGRELGIHRNSVRYRITQATNLLGVDLDDPDVAAQLWLALRA